MIKSLFCCIIFCAFLFSCRKNGNQLPQPTGDALYFPPAGSTEWQTQAASALQWNEAELTNLYTYLNDKHTKAFLILKNGRIVSEKYFGAFTADSLWFWASAGKTLTAFLVGIAQHEGLLNIEDKTSKYLGTGWTKEPADKENLITLRHQLTMTSGIEDNVPDQNCTTPACLMYKADAGTRWAYHNGVYRLLFDVVEQASNLSYNTYFQQKIRNPIGMNGLWVETNNGETVYYSNARSMARFGLLMLSRGVWDGKTILNDDNYFESQITTSQSLNLSYGYLTWLNGKSSYMLPTIQIPLSGSLLPNAPADMYAALGKYDQKMYVVPSQKLVVVRMGEDAGESRLAASSFDNELWGKLKVIIGY